MIDRGKFELLGIKLNAVDYEGALQGIMTAAQKAEPYSVSALAVHGLMTGALDKEHRYRLNQFSLLVPDGQPVRWALNWLHNAQLSERVYGPQLMLNTCEKAAQTETPIFLFGGNQTLLLELKNSLIQKFPTLKIAGLRASKFRTLSPQERTELIEEIRNSGAKIAFVGLGCPRQEIFTYEMCESLSMPVLAVGAAFNFHAGELEQAPPLLQKYGLEWAYRFLKEPRRLWRRYLFLNPAYVSLIALQATRIYRITSESGQKPTREISYG